MKRGPSRQKLTPGTVLAFRVDDNRWAYAQYLHSGRGLIYRLCELVAFFDYFTEELANAKDLVGKAWLFGPVFVSAHAAIKLKGWKVIGKIPVPPFEMPTFRWNEGGAWKPGVYHNWFLIHPSHHFFVGDLSPEHLQHELFYIHSLDEIVDRVRTGVNHDLEVR